jgi:hypothetical protein
VDHVACVEGIEEGKKSQLNLVTTPQRRNHISPFITFTEALSFREGLLTSPSSMLQPNKYQCGGEAFSVCVFKLPEITENASPLR